MASLCIIYDSSIYVYRSSVDRLVFEYLADFGVSDNLTAFEVLYPRESPLLLLNNLGAV